MANLKGLVSVVSQLREQRTNLVNDLKHVDAALSALSRLNGGTNHAGPRRTLSASARQEDCCRSETTVGKSPSAEGRFNKEFETCHANDVSIGSSQDRSRTTGTLGEGEASGLARAEARGMLSASVH